jgi:glutamate synthase (NADPH/NADH) small chain
MGDSRAFLTTRRALPVRQPPAERVRHWREFSAQPLESSLTEQSARCMDCAVPFCHGDTGCPVHNVIPEWNELVHVGRWRDASDLLHSTNNFPELTGRLCPAPCESACVLTLVDQPVTIRSIEQTIADRAASEGWITPRPPRHETGMRVAIIGSGPAGLAAAQQLRRAGHAVTVFERDDRPGGLLRYGIPDFKLEKDVLDRRLAQLVAEGIAFRTGVEVGRHTDIGDLRSRFDAVCLAIGACEPRDLPVPGRDLAGIHWAMDVLRQQNRRLAGDQIDPATEISARGKHVIIIGGGDTGSDCAGTCLRQRAASVRQLELFPQPPEARDASTPWPLWPMQLRTSHAHEEGCERDWSIATTRFSGHRGRVRRLHGTRVDVLTGDGGAMRFVPRAGGDIELRADLVLLAMGFAGVEERPWLRELGLDVARGRIGCAASHATTTPGVFVAGDARRGASLIVWAIREGRGAAVEIDRYLAR